MMPGIDSQEIAKIIELYAMIKNPEKRIFAQGYLNGLADAPNIPDSSKPPADHPA